MEDCGAATTKGHEAQARTCRSIASRIHHTRALNERLWGGGGGAAKICRDDAFFEIWLSLRVLTVETRWPSVAFGR